MNFLLVIGCTFINVFGKYIADRLHTPLLLDSIGTALCSCLLGPVAGCLSGLLGFSLWKIFTPVSWLYAITCIPLAFCISILYRRMTFRDPFQLISSGFLASFVSIAITFCLNFFLNHGYTGNLWGDALTNMFSQNGTDHTIACFFGHAFVEIPDKIITLAITFGIICLYGYIARTKKGGNKK
ncbi:MAG: hypothetical protein PUH02_09115 [bacterium]|nr:hypothetical protein [bacterium]